MRWHVFANCALLLWLTETAHAAPVDQVTKPNDAYRHNGFFLRTAAGAGYFSDAMTLNKPVDGRSGDVQVSGLSASGELSIGGTLKGIPLVIAGNFGFDMVNQPSDMVHPVGLNSLGPILFWYPNRAQGLNFSLGFGTSVAEVIGDVDGYSARAGVGYEFWIAEELSIGGQARMLAGTYDDSESASHFCLVPALMLTVTEH